VVLFASWLHRGTRGTDQTGTPQSWAPSTTDLEGAAGG
jgi:hypothetical protein